VLSYKQYLDQSVYFFIYLRTEFHMPICNGSLVTAIKQKTKELFLIVAMLLFAFQK
jgi:hypothetical protein